MKIRTTERLRVAALVAATLAVASGVQANVIFSTGNNQNGPGNVNIVADVDALSIIGDIGNTGRHVTFQNMIGPDGSIQVSMHSQHGDAWIESSFDAANHQNDHTGFTSITLVPDAGYGFDAGDFALDELNSGSSGQVKLEAWDQLGNHFTQFLAIDTTGQQKYFFTTDETECVVKLMFTVPTDVPFADLKQVSLTPCNVPDGGSTLAFAGFAFVGLGMLKRRLS